MSYISVRQIPPIHLTSIITVEIIPAFFGEVDGFWFHAMLYLFFSGFSTPQQVSISN